MRKSENKINWKYRIILILMAGAIFTATLYVLAHLIGEEKPDLRQTLLEGVIFTLLYGVGFFLLADYLPRNKNLIALKLQVGEKVEHEGAANLRRGIEWVGGKLFLTDRRLVFLSHNFNIQKGQTSLGREDIGGILRKKALFFFKNRIHILTTAGKKYDLILADRETWIQKLLEKK